jgi:hypothetical protein
LIIDSYLEQHIKAVNWWLWKKKMFLRI